MVLRRPIADSHLHSPYKPEAAKYELSIFCAPVLRLECICKRSATIKLTFSFSSPRGRQRLCARSTTGCLSSRMASHSECDIWRVGRGREGACGGSSGGSDAHRARKESAKASASGNFIALTCTLERRFFGVMIGRFTQPSSRVQYDSIGSPKAFNFEKVMRTQVHSSAPA